MGDNRMRIAVAGLTAAATLVVPLVTAPSAGAAGSVRSAISLTAPAAATFGSKTTLRGVLGRAGTNTRIAGARVILQRATPGRTNWTSVTSTLTASHGGYVFSPSTGRPFDYRVIWPGNATYTLAVSPVRSGSVRPLVLFPRMQNWEPWGSLAYPEATIYPGRRGRPVFVQRYEPGTNTFRNLAFLRTTSTDSTVRIEARVGGRTAYYRIYAPAFDGLAAAYSPVRRHTSYSSRGAFRRPLVETGGIHHPTFKPLTVDQDPRRRFAAAYAGRGGTAWADLDVAGCNYVLFDYRGIEGVGGDTRISVLLDGREVHQATLPEPDGPWFPPALPYDVRVLGHRTVRFQVSDVDTANGPRAIFDVDAVCSS